MLITTLYAMRTGEPLPIGKVTTRKLYTPALAIKLRNKLHVKFPKMHYFKMVENETEVLPKDLLTGPKGALYLVRTNQLTGQKYRRYFKRA